MEIVGSHVKHKVFGEGIVEAQEGRHITISFEAGEKKFSYPEVFRKICEMEDEDLKASIQQALLLNDSEKQKIAESEWNSIQDVQNFKARYRIK